MAIILLGIVLLGVVLLLFESRYYRNDRYDMLLRNVEQAVSLTKVNYEANSYRYLDRNALLTGYSILAGAINADIFLTDTDGKILLCTDTEETCVHTGRSVSPEELLSASSNSYQSVGTMDMYSESHYNVGLPVRMQNGEIIAYIFASTSTSGHTIFLTEILQMFLLSAAGVVVISMVVIYFITDNMAKPLIAMAAATKSFAAGDFTVRVPVGTNDEIGNLAMSINSMATSLATLEQTSRSFIANVSHELRTPMTTISGFIDGILDGTIPPNQQNKYLAIVSEEVKRLSRLVVSMLNIAKIEAGETQISPKAFDINDTVCRVVFSFEQAIEAKNLEIIGLDTDKVMVMADPDLIHQVVYNLVDNAVKFTNQDGYISFEYTQKNDFIYVSVKNSGEGISQENLVKVFERFYKTDRSRSLDKNGVGLGLHIVRSIVQMHGGEISANSQDGVYTEFTFSVPCYTPAPKPAIPLFLKKDAPSR